VRREALALVLVLLAGGCALRPAAVEVREEDLAVAGAPVHLEFLGDDAATAREVARAVSAALPRIARWGGLAEPVTITIHPSHASLEEAIGRDGYPWLRAWARYRSIDLQSPRTWGPRDGGRGRLEELVTHELAHCAMYQRAGDASTWMYKGIPRWFTEGLASVTAGQEARHGGIERLYADYARLSPGAAGGLSPGERDVTPGAGDPLDGSEAVYQGRSEVVYRAAHHAFAFLLARYGEARVRAVLDRMARGQRFPSAFRAAIGIGDAEFAAEFRRYVVWQGWRR
jgi:hypothetical protein